MKKIFCILGIAAMLFGAFGCKKEKPIDVNDITEDGVYVIGEATGATAVSAIYGMAKGHNEAKENALRDGMFEKYIVLEGGKDFSLVWVNGSAQTAYGATLAEFTPTDFGSIYADNPATAVFKGKLEIGENAPKMRVATTGLYHIVLDLNLENDLDDAQIVVSPVQYGVRGGMNNWGFTALEATAPKNDGITYTLTGQELGSNGEFKFAYNGGWKITLDSKGEVKANTNLGKDSVPGGSNIVVADGAGKYKITLTYKLAAGDVANSFKYTVEQESKASYPEHVYMIGAAWGNWAWESEGIVDLPHISAGGDPKDGCFVVTRYFKADEGFKFSTINKKDDWTKAFASMTTNPENVTWDNDGNIHVPADGLWTITLDYTADKMSLNEGMIYGMGPCFNNDWTTGKYAGELNADGTATITTLSAGALRVYAPCAFDWWQHEFQPDADGNIEYRTGGELAAYEVEANVAVTFDFNAGTVSIGAPFTPAITIDGNFDDWAGIAGADPDGAFQAFKVTNDAKNFYFYVETDPGTRLWSGGAYLYLYFDFDNDLTTGSYSGSTGMGDNHYEAYIYMFLFGGNQDAPAIIASPEGEAKGLTMNNIAVGDNKPATASDIVKMEIVIPRANFTDQVKAGDVIGVGSYRSKDGGNIHLAGYTVK